MKRYEELYKTKGYWMTKIQNDLFGEVSKYLEKRDINQTEFAKELSVSKSYISQVMNGNFNFTLSKFVDLSLAMNKVPFTFESLDEYVKRMTKRPEGLVISLNAINISSTQNATMPMGDSKIIHLETVPVSKVFDNETEVKPGITG
jgi:transcriptional regulator with XRE-family HTH domain